MANEQAHRRGDDPASGNITEQYSQAERLVDTVTGRKNHTEGTGAAKVRSDWGFDSERLPRFVVHPLALWG